MPNAPKFYLGDGVYAADYAGMIQLSTERVAGHDIIYLEYDTFENLCRYAQKVWKVDIRIAKFEGEENG